MHPLTHEELVIRRGKRSGLLQVVAVHSTARGPATGGTRMNGYGSAEEAIDDALRLSEAMTFKTAVADFPNGGGKGVIVREEDQEFSPAQRRAAMLDYGDLVESLGGRFSTGEDVGITEDDVRA